MSRHPSPASFYHPITAQPFRHNAAYVEIPPCDALKPYIRCFWGTPEPVRTADYPSEGAGLVIPDTCMDILFTVDETRGTLDGVFCTMSEDAVYTGSHVDTALTSTFAIRFYAWTATLFAERPFSGSKNGYQRVDDFFPALDRQLTPRLMSVSTLRERAEIATGYLLKQLNEFRCPPVLMNAADSIVRTRGTAKISDLTASQAISPKRLERVFDEHIGLSPKSFSSLVRYQLLWQELCLGRPGDPLDLVEKYGYYDQAHLLNDFRRRHSMTPAQALQLARG